jgi:magnesium-transporting ATPase (P-type)
LIPINNLQTHALDAETILNILSTSKSGLSTTEAQSRLAMYGENKLPAYQTRPAWLRLALQFHNPLIYVLLVASIITFLLNDFIDAGVIFVVVLINAWIGFVQEGKAEQALRAVQAMMASHAKVIRDAQHHEIDATQLVLGDIVILEPGDKVPADLRLIQVKNVHVMEAALTGESVPVEKSTQQVEADCAMADRNCIAFSSTIVTAGHAHGVVVATAKETEIGKIGTLVSEVKKIQTPLTRRLDVFAKQITFVILIIAALAFAFGYWVRHMPVLELFLAIVGLVVAAIPEGLPAIVTIMLAIGTRVMAKNKAIIRRLPAVETLGSVTVICSDKTGTLTCNEMTAVTTLLPTRTLRISGVGYSPEGGFFRDNQTVDATTADDLHALLMCATLCNDAEIQHDEAGIWRLVGDPTEGALQTLATKAEIDKQDMNQRYPRLDCIPFESEHQYMATLHHSHNGEVWMLLKGAPEKVLSFCSTDAIGPLEHAVWESRIAEAAKRGERVLALARRLMPKETAIISMADIDAPFELLGMVGMIDPPRAEVIAAVAECQTAGLRVVMITGDHAVTASAIAKQIGLNVEEVLTGDVVEKLSDDALRERIKTVDVIARAAPQHKLRLVSALQDLGELVAMTGDGVNDAPAIKAADIGVAMGNKGTEAAREAADLVLTDDNFATIANAVKQGRVVLDNVKKSLLFLLPTNGGESGVILLSIFTGIAMPITAGQILWVNMVTAVTLALAIAFEPPERGVMQRPPRSPKEPLITKVLGFRILFVSILMVVVTFAVFEWEIAKGNSLALARTAAVNMLVMGEVVYLFNVRFFTASSLSFHTFIDNRVALWMVLCVFLLQILFTYLPWMQTVFNTEALSLSSWVFIFALAMLMFLMIEFEKAILRYRQVKTI